MLRKLISALLLLAVMMTCLTGCGMDLIRGIIKEYEDNKDGIISEFRELKDGMLLSLIHIFKTGFREK